MNNTFRKGRRQPRTRKWVQGVWFLFWCLLSKWKELQQ